MDPFTLALERKGDMVGKRQDGIVVELVGKLQVGCLDDIGRDGEHLRLELFKQGQIMLVDVVERALDGGKGKIARLLVDGEGDALAKGDNGATFGIRAHHSVVVYSLGDFHGTPLFTQPVPTTPRRGYYELLDHASRGVALKRANACAIKLPRRLTP